MNQDIAGGAYALTVALPGLEWLDTAMVAVEEVEEEGQPAAVAAVDLKPAWVIPKLPSIQSILPESIGIST